MDISIHRIFLPHTDPEASLVFYRDALGFEVRKDVGSGTKRWITIGSPDQPGISIVLHPATIEPGTTADERRVITEMMAKGTYARVVLAGKDIDDAFARARAGGAPVVQEPTRHLYGIRDCAVSDPAGNQVRIRELL